MNKTIIFLLNLWGICSNHAAASAFVDLEELSVTAHLHRLMARHEIYPSRFSKTDLAISMRYVFDKASVEGNLTSMSQIVGFLVSENILPEELREFRAQLFSQSSLHQLEHSHIASEFRRTLD